MNISEKAKDRLEHFQKEEENVRIYLVNGVKLEGKITDVQDDHLILKRGSDSQMIFFPVGTIDPTSGSVA